MTFTWGIIGTGGIAGAFVRDLSYTEDHKAVAVGSRSLEGADRFGEENGIADRYSSYEALVNEAQVDAIYVATPHPDHSRSTVIALNAGKPVLCEKPFAMSAKQTSEMIGAARANNVMLMEAMWARFLPHMHEIRTIINNGVIGEIISVQADHGQWFPEDPKFRLFAPELGGGALLDLGIYPVSFAHMVLGKPSKITAVSDPAFTGVDAQTSAIFQYPNGAHAILTTTLSSATPCAAVISGTLGRIEIDRTFYAPTSFRVTLRSGEVTEFPRNYVGHGLREQAIEFARCVRAGLTESPILTLSETFDIMSSLDEIRSQIGLTYEVE
ncbi:MAG: Gfo/Idh/MocA family oxidoreductase [Actinomycetes bacterium]